MSGSDKCMRIYKDFVKEEANASDGDTSIQVDEIATQLKAVGLLRGNESAQVSHEVGPMAKSIKLFHDLLPAKSLPGLEAVVKIMRQSGYEKLHAMLIRITANYFQPGDLDKERFPELYKALKNINPTEHQNDQAEAEQTSMEYDHMR